MLELSGVIVDAGRDPTRRCARAGVDRSCDYCAGRRLAEHGAVCVDWARTAIIYRVGPSCPAARLARRRAQAATRVQRRHRSRLGPPHRRSGIAGLMAERRPVGRKARGRPYWSGSPDLRQRRCRYASAHGGALPDRGSGGRDPLRLRRRPNFAFLTASILWGQVLVVCVDRAAASSGPRRSGRPGASASSRSSARPGSSSLGWPVYPPPPSSGGGSPTTPMRRAIFVEGAASPRPAGSSRSPPRSSMSVWRAREAQRRHDLRLGALGDPRGGRARRPARRRRRVSRPARAPTICATTAPSTCSASRRPARGKGVGLVVPTLLTWPGSAVVHDIKGENWQLTAGWRSRFPRAAVQPDRRRAAPPTIRCSRSAAASTRSATSRTSPTSWSIPKARSSGATTGRRPATRCWSARSSTSSTPRRTRRSPASPTFLSDPQRPFEATLRRDDDDPASRRRAAPHPGRRLGGARAAQQERERALRRAVDRDVVPRPLPRSDRRRRSRAAATGGSPIWSRRERPVSLYLVVPPSDISRTKPLIRLILNQIGRRLTEELRRRRTRAPPAAADARRVPGARPARLLRDRAGLHGRLRRCGPS